MQPGGLEQSWRRLEQKSCNVVLATQAATWAALWPRLSPLLSCRFSGLARVPRQLLQHTRALGALPRFNRNVTHVAMLESGITKELMAPTACQRSAGSGHGYERQAG